MNNETRSQQSEQPATKSRAGTAALLRWGLPLLAVVLLAGFAVSRLGHSWQEPPRPVGDAGTIDPAHRTTLTELRARTDRLKSLARECDQAQQQPTATGGSKAAAPSRKPLFDAGATHKKLDEIELSLGDADTGVRLAAVGRELDDREQDLDALKRGLDQDLAAKEAALAEIPGLKETITRQQAEIADMRKQLAEAKSGGNADAAKEIERLNEQIREAAATQAQKAQAVMAQFCEKCWEELSTPLYKDSKEVQKELAALRELARKNSDPDSVEFIQAFGEFLKARFGLSLRSTWIASEVLDKSPKAIAAQIRAWWHAKLREQ